MKKSKQEVLLSDVFRAVKASKVMHGVGHKTYATRGREYMLDNINRRLRYARERPFTEDSMHELTEIFFYTKPITGLTKDAAFQMYRNYAAIRKLRNTWQENKPKIIMTAHEKEQRLYPLPEHKYHEFAKRIWEKYGKPQWGKSKFMGVFFGRPTTKWNYRRNTLVSRTIGVEFLMKKNFAFGIGCHISEEKRIFFGKKVWEEK